MSFQSCLAHSTDLGESLFFFKIYFFIEVRLLCNIELISAVQQSDSVIHVHTFLIIFFSIVVYPESLFLSSIKHPCIPLINLLPPCPSLSYLELEPAYCNLKHVHKTPQVSILCAKSLHSCLTLCDPMDCSSPGSPVHGILQAGILEWVATSSSRGSCRPRDRTRVS